MNLLDFDFQSSPLLKNLPTFTAVTHKGVNPDKVRIFDVVRGAESHELFSCMIIHKNEKLLWVSFKDMIEHTFRTATAEIQGVFGFDLLSCDLGKSSEQFQSHAFAGLLANKARAMNVGDETLVQYSSIFGLFKKRLKETWGKLDLEAHVEVFNKEPEQFDLFLKKTLKDTAATATSGKFILAIQDLSSVPIFKFGSEPQTERLAKTLEKFKVEHPQVSPEVYIIHRGQAVELFAQFK